jgi:HSP20 family protein
MSSIARDGEPLRAMRDLLQWDPFRELAASMPERAMAENVPNLEVQETKTGFVLRADLPGVKLSDVGVSLTGNRLTLSGKRESESESKEKGEAFYLYERSYGAFTRSLTLPADVDPSKIHAELRDGVLTIELPKTIAMQSQKIEVKGAPPQKG